MYLREIVFGLVILPALTGAQPDPHSRDALKRALTASGSVAAYWRNAHASFLAVIDSRTRVHSVVRIDSGRTEIRFDGALAANVRGERVTSLDLEGLRTADAVVLFHTEPQLARSVLSFDTGKDAAFLRYIVTGVAPGIWEIWRNGWVVDIGVPVRQTEGVLYFEGPSGSYFVRRLN